MKLKTSKPYQNKPASRVAQTKKQSSTGAKPIINQRPEAIAQGKLVDVINNSDVLKQAGQLKANITTGKTVVQRELSNINTDGDGKYTVKTDSDRPPTNLPSSQGQGDHLTPWSVIQDQVVNCIAGKTKKEAWGNLSHTLDVYKDLPGWSSSSQWVKNVLAPHVAGLLASGGDAQELLDAANQMLRLRNQIDLTAVPGGTGGHGEAAYQGGLQYQETQLQKGKALGSGVTKTAVMDFMWKAFEHGRHDSMNTTKQKRVRAQHVSTMLDAYWQLAEAKGISASDLAKHYGTKSDWAGYKP